MTLRPSTLYPLDLHGWFRWQEPMERMLNERKPKNCVEVGTWLGLSAIFVAERIAKWDGRLLCIDTWRPDWYNEDPQVLKRAPEVFDRFCSNIWHLGLQNIVTPYRGRACEATVADSIDWAYVDGGHEYVDVNDDLRFLWPRMKSGGILLADDYGMDGVKIAWNQLATDASKTFYNVEGQLVWMVK